MKRALDWLFKDMQGRRGKYVITETPNAPLIIFMVFIIIAVVSDPGVFQLLPGDRGLRCTRHLVYYGSPFWSQPFPADAGLLRATRRNRGGFHTAPRDLTRSNCF